MCPADFRVLAAKLYRARVPQVLVEGVLRQVVIEKALPRFNLLNIRPAGNRFSVLQGDFLNVVDRRFLEAV